MLVLTLVTAALAAPLPPCATVTQVPSLCPQRLAPASDFQQPLWYGEVGGQAYVLERPGRIQRLTPEGPVLFADLTDRVLSRGQEEGLLGIAFHPDYSKNNRLYVYYTASLPRRGVLAEFQAGPAGVDPLTERILLEVRQPYPNHNGGALLFGPDGMLYLALGDGGAANDPHGHGQDTATLLGNILRLDVRGRPYGIPADNPFAAGGPGRPEIWAWGLRNVWRMSFDPVTGSLWAGDVGQNAWEEIDLVQGGHNYGWNLREGKECFRNNDCDTPGLTEPIHVYGRDKGVSVTAGPVYRGSALPALQGAPIFGDFGSGSIWALCQDGAAARAHLLSSSGLHPAHFGVDAKGELIVVHLVGPPTGKTGGLYQLSSDCSP